MILLLANPESIDWPAVALRWLHVVAAVIALGGAIFMRQVLMPAAQQLPDEPHRQLRDDVRRRFGRLFLAALVTLMLTGLYNYVMIEVPRHRGQGAYHGLIGGKILLALAVFFLGSALTGRAAAFEGIRRNARAWLGVNILLALAIVLLAGIARALPVRAGG